MGLGAGSNYTIAENDFMATGGDGYPILSSRATTRDIMDQVVADYIAAQSPISPAIQGRVNCTTTGPTACAIVTPLRRSATASGEPRTRTRPGRTNTIHPSRS